MMTFPPVIDYIAANRFNHPPQAEMAPGNLVQIIIP
jgi:hypothetical protein